MYNLHLTAEQLEFRDTVRDFVNDEVKPVTLKADRLDLADRSLPIDVLRKASQMGLRTLALPEDLGGVGADALTCCIVTEELAVGDTDVAAVLTETSALARRLFPAMTPEQGDRFLAAFLEDDDYHLACAEREPDDDTALGVNYHRPVTGERRVATTATRSGNEWIINGDQGRRRQRAGRQADRGRGADRQGPGADPGAARYAGAFRHRAARPALVSRRLRPDRVEGLPGAGRQSAQHRRAAGPRPRRALSRRRSTSASAAPPTRPRWTMRSFACRAAVRSPSIRRSAPSSPTSRSDSTSRAASSGAPPGPRIIRTRLPTAACPTCRCRPSPRSTPPRRSIARPRTPPNASAPWA